MNSIVKANLFSVLEYVEQNLPKAKTPAQILFLANEINEISKRHKELEHQDRIRFLQTRNKLQEKLEKKAKQVNKGYAGYLDEKEAYHFTSIPSLINVFEENRLQMPLSITTNILLGEKETSTIKDYNQSMGSKATRFSDLDAVIVFDLNKVKAHSKFRLGSKETGTHFGEYEIVIDEFEKPFTYFINRIEIAPNKIQQVMDEKIYVFLKSGNYKEMTFGSRAEMLNIPLVAKKKIEVKEVLFGHTTPRYAAGGLIAPNGKKSNLTPEQYALVRTPEFKAWFGDWENSPETASKVVDENGEPLVVYHGTKPNRYAFNIFQIYNEGAFFSEDRYVAKRYSYNYNQTEYGEIKSVFLNIRKPEFVKSVKYKYEGFSGADANLKKRSEKMKQKYPELKNTPYKYKDLVRETSQKKGYDGFILENHSWGDYIDKNSKQYAVFSPTQIKLADGSNTTFDGSNPDIRYAKGGVLDSLNPTGSVFADYSAEQIDKLPLGKNITTYDKTAGLKPEQQVTVYRGVPAGVTQIVSGDFITTNKQLAKDYAGIDNVISMIVRADEILDDITEPLGEEYILRLHTPRFSAGGLIHSLKRILPKRILKLSDLPF
jgi:hypothetical protein